MTDSGPVREKTLAEYVDGLPVEHLARRQYSEMVAAFSAKEPAPTPSLLASKDAEIALAETLAAALAMAAKALAKAMNVDAIHPDVRAGLAVAIRAHTAAVLRGTEAGDTAKDLRFLSGEARANIMASDVFTKPLATAASLIESLTIALAEERGKVAELAEAKDAWRQEWRETSAMKGDLKARLALVENLTNSALKWSGDGDFDKGYRACASDIKASLRSLTEQDAALLRQMAAPEKWWP